MCVMACATGASVCSTFSNNILPTGVPIHKFSGLAAVTVSDAQDWRVYYHDENSFLCQMEGKASGFTKGAIIGGTALNNSAIEAVNVNSTTNNIVLYYVDQGSQNMFTQQFTGVWTTGELPSKSFSICKVANINTGVALSTARIKSWNPLSGIGAAFSSTQNQLHVYYTGLDSLIYEFVGSNASTTKSYSAQPSNQREWTNADIVGGAITAVGWKDQVRFFQQSQGVLIEGVLSNTTWSQVSVGTS